MSIRRYFGLLVVLAGIYGCDRSDLGENFFLMRGDRVEDRAVVYCSGRSFGQCIVGTSIIPTYDRQFENGSYREYVESVKSNEDWIIARTLVISNKTRNYWILNKSLFLAGKIDSEPEFQRSLKKSMIGPIDSVAFSTRKAELGISLNF